MKEQVPFLLLLLCAAFLGLPDLNAQRIPEASNPGTVKVHSITPPACDACIRMLPTEVLTSAKNAVTIYGPPDSKGDPVEYQVFTQSRTDGIWKLEAAGQVSKPGDKVTFKYYRPAQLLVLLFCNTPFGQMATFSNVRVGPPSTTDPCTDCVCERCEHEPPIQVYSSIVKGVTLRRASTSMAPVEYQVFTQTKDRKWAADKTNVIKEKGGEATACFGASSSALVLVYDKTAKDRKSVTFSTGPCKQ